MARDGWRVFLWDDDIVDPRVALKPVAVGLAAGGPSFRETVAALELPAKSAAAGILAALLYGAPVLFIVNIFLGLGGRLIGAILAAAAFVGSVATWRITTRESAHWERERERLSDHADPPPWR